MRTSATSKLRIVARIGVLSFSEFIQKHGEDYIPTQLNPEEAKILEAPNSVAELEQKIQSFPDIWEKVLLHVKDLPPEKQKEGELFVNNLAAYFSQMQKALSDIKQIDQSTSSEPVSSEDWWAGDAEELKELEPEWSDNIFSEKQKQRPWEKDYPRVKPEKKVAPKKPRKEKNIETPPLESKQPEEPIDPSTFDPNLRTLPTEEEEQKGEKSRPTKSEFAQSPEEGKQQNDTETDANAVAVPTKKIEQEVIDLLDWVKKIPDLQVKRDPAKFKSDVATSIDSLIAELNQLKPIVDTMLTEYAFEPETFA
jgi:hypothetical protein